MNDTLVGYVELTARVVVGLTYVMHEGGGSIRVYGRQSQMRKQRDRIMFIDHGEACGVASPTAYVQTDGTNLTRKETNVFKGDFGNVNASGYVRWQTVDGTEDIVAGTYLDFTPINFTSSGAYKVCFCDSLALPHSRERCMGEEDYRVELGLVHVGGTHCLLTHAEFQRGECYSMDDGSLACRDRPLPFSDQYYDH